MATLRELTYMVLDELKLSSDDSYFNEEHITFLINKYRAFSLKQVYKDIRRDIPESNYQILHLKLIDVPQIEEEKRLIKTEYMVPFMLNIGAPKIYYKGNYTKEITYISRERMRYVGQNKWLKDIIYASLGIDNCLYLTSANVNLLGPKIGSYITIKGIFEHPDKVAQLNPQASNSQDFMDEEYPLEEGLIPQLIELVVKELSVPKYSPEDKQNDANDNLSEVKQVKNG